MPLLMAAAACAMTALFAVTFWPCAVMADWHFTPSDHYPDIPAYGPQPNSPYMVDNRNNFFGTVPDKGTHSGAVWLQSGSFEDYMAKLRSTAGVHQTQRPLDDTAPYYWLPDLAPLGQQPLAGNASVYKVYRSILDYGADPTGQADSTEAINAAVEDGWRCGPDCDGSFSHGAIVYFPPGRYRICRPIVQWYFTQFIGHPFNKPVIVGCDTFRGIALIDTNPYIAGGGGKSWYISQNQFFRQIRNMIFDLTEMPLDTTDDSGNPYVPTAIHWQVSQATSLQNLEFNMPIATTNKPVTHVGLWTENGSGGFVSDLLFKGGNIGWRVGSQQYTAQNIAFLRCLTAVQMIWDWGFNWQGILVDGGAVAFNISGRGGDDAAGIGSVSIIDCSVQNVPVAILTNRNSRGSPSIVIDNLNLINVEAAVQTADTNEVILFGAEAYVDLWAIGWVYNGDIGRYLNGSVDAPRKARNLLRHNRKTLFTQARPGYETSLATEFLVATQEGVLNDGTGDQTASVNAFLEKAASQKKIAFFPAGIYQVKGTVFIPVNSKVQGSLWSQIMGTGSVFSNGSEPQVMVRVGNTGDVGAMAIAEMLFTVKGYTPGAILMEWNVHEGDQGAAGMWDSHFRVGGAKGTDLDIMSCPKDHFNQSCIAASLMLHVTSQASGYFENVWAWAADHDVDFDGVDPPSNQINVYAGRGMLIQSAGPSWFYGTGSEHSALYQYQLFQAKNIYLGHVQTESPYYQPDMVSDLIFPMTFPGDPAVEDFAQVCALVRGTFGLRITNSTDVTVHSAGLYSFYQNYDESCVQTSDCQTRILQVKGSNGTVIFNIFTVGVEQVANGINNQDILQAACQNGFSTEVSVWVPTLGFDDSPDALLGTCSFPTLAPSSTSRTSVTPTITLTKTSSSSSKTNSKAPPKPTGTASPDCTTEQCKIDAGYGCNCTDKSKCPTWYPHQSPDCCVDNSCPLCICGHAGECTLDSPKCCQDAMCDWACIKEGDERMGCPYYIPKKFLTPYPSLENNVEIVNGTADEEGDI